MKTFRTVLVVALIILCVATVVIAAVKLSGSGGTNSGNITINNNVGNTVSYATAPKINVNECSPEELAALPGIGDVLAQRIVDSRPLADMTDLDRISGIGPKTVEKLAGRLEF